MDSLNGIASPDHSNRTHMVNCKISEEDLDLVIPLDVKEIGGNTIAHAEGRRHLRPTQAAS